MLSLGVSPRHRLEAAILAQFCLRHQEIELPDRRLHVVRIDFELRDAVIALQADGGDAVLHVQSFGIDLPFADDRFAAFADKRRHAEIVDAGGPAVRVAADRPEEPEAGIGDADEVGARRHEAEGRQRAEIIRRRRHLQSADILERPEQLLVAPDPEALDRPREDLHAFDGSGLRLGGEICLKTKQDG